MEVYMDKNIIILVNYIKRKTKNKNRKQRIRYQAVQANRKLLELPI